MVAEQVEHTSTNNSITVNWANPSTVPTSYVIKIGSRESETVLSSDPLQAIITENDTSNPLVSATRYSCSITSKAFTGDACTNEHTFDCYTGK